MEWYQCPECPEKHPWVPGTKACPNRINPKPFKGAGDRLVAVADQGTLARLMGATPAVLPPKPPPVPAGSLAGGADHSSEKQFDRKAYQRGYMKEYMKEYRRRKHDREKERGPGG